MEQWSGNVWTAIIAAFIVGLVVGFVVLRVMKGNVQKQIQIESELKATKAQVAEQKVQLEQHFQQSAALLATLAEDYKKLYTHLAQGSETLLPTESKIEFFEQARLEVAKEEQNQEDQPKDYSEGSSGLLKS